MTTDPEYPLSPLEHANCNGFVNLFNSNSKADLEKYCQDFVVRQVDLVMWIMIAKAGGLEGYRYACHFADAVPEHLHPSSEERAALFQNGVGPMEGKAKKAASKISQLFVERRHFCAHLFYTMDGKYWFLFYFDQRDISARKNHWKHGSHIHLLSYHWPNLQLDDVWQKVLKRETNFSSKIHLRYVNREQTGEASSHSPK